MGSSAPGDASAVGTAEAATSSSAALLQTHLAHPQAQPSLGTIPDAELTSLVLDCERLRGRIEILQSEALVELDRRRTALDSERAGGSRREDLGGGAGCAALDRRQFRNTRLWLAHELRLPSRLVGHRTRRAQLLDGVLAPARELLADGRISPCHLDPLARLAARAELGGAIERDLPVLLRWAEREAWPIYTELLDGWAEMMDPRDPAETNRRVAEARRLIWGQGLDNAVLVELDTSALRWEQILTAAQPIFDRMVEEDWAGARSEHGDETTVEHLTRTRSQRWHDAFVEVLMAGVTALAADPDAPVSSSSLVVHLVADHRSLEDEADRWAHSAVAASDEAGLRRRPCRTLHGLRISPSTALLAALSGRIRRVLLDQSGRKVEISRSARLFRGPSRTALIIRDQYCVAAGCQTPAHRCEADHIVPVTRDGPTTLENGQMLCGPCHRHKTQLEAEGLPPPDAPHRR